MHPSPKVAAAIILTISQIQLSNPTTTYQGYATVQQTPILLQQNSTLPSTNIEFTIFDLAGKVVDKRDSNVRVSISPLAISKPDGSLTATLSLLFEGFDKQILTEIPLDSNGVMTGMSVPTSIIGKTTDGVNFSFAGATVAVVF